MSRVLVLAHLIDPVAPLQVQALQEVAPSLGVSLHIRDVRTAADVPPAFDAAVRERASGLLTTSGSIFFIERARVVELAARHRWPAIYPYATFAADGNGLMAYGVRTSELHRHAAVYIDKILRGQAFRTRRAAADDVQARHQPEDGEGPRPQHPPP